MGKKNCDRPKYFDNIFFLLYMNLWFVSITTIQRVDPNQSEQQKYKTHQRKIQIREKEQDN